MFTTIKNAWRIPDLRKKIFFTLLVIVVFRLGSVIPVPFLDAVKLQALMASVDASGSALSYINMLTGGAFSYATIFAMGITPYINSSIIMQLLSIAIPALERLSKNGEEGRKKIASITRLVTVGLGLLQGTAFFFYLHNSGITVYPTGVSAVIAAIVIILCFTAGTAVVMWLGEQINEKGIGNGISIILFAGIVARLPVTFGQLWSFFLAALSEPTTYWPYFIFVPFFVVLFLIVIWVIIFMQDAERRIPVQYAKRVVGRRVYGGQNSHLPVKVAMSGVMPVIFASAILSIPSTIQLFTGTPTEGFWAGFYAAFSTSGWLYMILYFLLILAFAYFYMSIQYNPMEMANNIRSQSGTIPGIRPGKPTADFIMKVLSKLTLIGALFLAFVAIIPVIYGALTGMSALSMGGTSLIIMVGVALETVKQMEAQMMMRHYKGFLD